MIKNHKTKTSKIKKYLKKTNKKMFYGLSVLVVAILGVGLMSISKADSSPMYTFNASSIQGGGFQNVIAVDPTDYRNAFLGGDVAGVHVWNNTEGRFYARNIGLFNTNHKNVAAVEYSKYFTTNGKPHMYVATGHNNSGFILKSVDGGESWSEEKSGLRIHGGNTDITDTTYPSSAYNLNGGNPISEEHPRSTGKLFTEGQSGSDKYLFISGFDNDIYRVKNDDFSTGFKVIDNTDNSGLPVSAHFRGIASNSGDINNIFVADLGLIEGSGAVYCSVNGASNSPTFVKLTGGPVRPEELVFIGGVLYVAAGDQGVYKFTSSGSGCTGSWTILNNGLNPMDVSGSDPKYQSIDGYTEGVNTILYVGVAKPKLVSSGNYSTILRSTNGGASWNSIVNSASSGGNQNNIFGGFNPNGSIKLTGESYWNYASQKLSSSSAVASQIDVVNRGVWVNDDIVYSPGRGGGNITADGGQNWYPNLKGIGVTINNDLATDPNNPDRAFVTNTDWMAFGLTNNATNQPKQMKTPTGNKGYVFTLDSIMTNSPLYVGVGNRDDATNGEVYELPDSNPTSFTGQANWLTTNFGTAAGGNTPVGIAVGHTNTSAPTIANRVLLAYAIDQGCNNSATADKAGLYRKVGTGDWTRIIAENALVGGNNFKIAGNYTGGNNCKLNGRIRMQWADGQKVYIYSPESGLWKSTDGGINWGLKWAVTSPQGSLNSGSTDMKFFMAIDKLNPDIVSVGITTSVKKINTATNFVSTYALSVGTRDIGAIAYDYNNNFYITYGPTSNGTDPAGIQYCAAGGVSCVEIAYGGTANQSNSYQATLAAADTFAMEFSPNGTMYIATNGSGVLVGTSSVSPPPNTPPMLSGSLGSSNLTSNSVKLSWSAGSDVDGDSLSYRIKKNGKVLTTVTALSYNVTNLSASTAYTFTVEAYDGTVYSSAISLNVTTLATPPTTKSPNLDNQGLVDITDLAILLSYWGTNNSSSDLDSNGKINIIDLSLLLNAWGTSG